jgi:phosphoenolpyruvate carboxylase
LETVDDLGAGVRILAELAANKPYRAHLAKRRNRQLIMIGYSDSNKDSGITAARWALQCAQRELTGFAEQEGIAIAFFHGRGGTVSRGGGNMVHGINAAPAGSVNAYLRVTEQGEVIRQKYGIRPLAVRNLEQITGATVTATLRKPPNERSQWSAIMADIAATARTRYRGLVYGDDRFEPYFRQATPIDVIERLAIGSRPSARRTKRGIQNLRAIPWVFSWSQTRISLPGSFGLGAGLTAAIDQYGMDAIRDMLRWPFFGSLINDVEMVMAKSDLEIGQHYSQLADSELRPVFAEIETESRRTESLILQIKDTDHLLSNDETLRRAIRLRNPYVDPLNLLQIRLLAEWRAGNREDDALLATLFETVNGIARGIQNTG